MNNWNREQILLAINLYFKIPFGQYDHRNREVIELANLINRTPSSVAMKLSNLASLDTKHQTRGVSGLANASKLDKEVWAETTSNWEQFVEESEETLVQLAGVQEDIQLVDPNTLANMPTEAIRSMKVRLKQRFFRKMIIAAYSSCCVCGIPIPELLVASHIIPWRDREDIRLNPQNGLCLCVLHDKAFDNGYMTVLPSYHILISPAIDKYLSSEVVVRELKNYHQQPIKLPSRYNPHSEFLESHNQIYFRQV